MKVLKKLTHGFETIPAEIKNLACIITSFKCLWTMRLPTANFWFQLTPEYPSTRNQNLPIMKQKFAPHRTRKHSGNLRLPPGDFSPSFNREFQVIHYEEKIFALFLPKSCPKYCCHQLISRLIQVSNNLLRFPLLWNKIFLSLSKMLPVIPRSTFWGSELTTDRIPLGSMMRIFLPIFGPSSHIIYMYFGLVDFQNVKFILSLGTIPIIFTVWLANWAISRGLYAAHMGPISGLCGAFLAVESVNGRPY